MNLFGPDAVNAGADARRTFVGHPGGTKPTIIYHYLQAIEETTRVTKVPTSRASKHCGTTVPGAIFFLAWPDMDRESSSSPENSQFAKPSTFHIVREQVAVYKGAECSNMLQLQQVVNDVDRSSCVC